MLLSRATTSVFQKKNFNKSRIVDNNAHIWDEDGKWIKMSTNKPIFGPVVLKITKNFS